jgi:hypothetical protein
VLLSNLDRDTVYSNRIFLCAPASMIPGDFEGNSLIRPQPRPSKYFSIHRSPTVLTIDAIYYQIITASLNKLRKGRIDPIFFIMSTTSCLAVGNDQSEIHSITFSLDAQI